MKKLLLMVFAFAFAFGCQKEAKKDKPAKEAPPLLEDLPKELPATSAASRGPAGEMLGYMPQDSSVILGLALAKATKSKLFIAYQDKIMADGAKDVAEVKEKCGIDMMADTTTVVLAIGKDIQDPDSIVIGVKGNFDQRKIEDCVVKMGGKVEGTVMTSPSGEGLNTFWAARDTVLISKGRSSDALKRAKAGSNVTQNKDMMELMGKVDSNATFWVAGTVPPDVAGTMAGMGAPPKSGYLSVNLGSGLGAKAGLIFNTEDEAKGMSTMIEMGLNMGKQQEGMKEILDAVGSTLSGNTITINAKLTSAQLDQLMSMSTGLF